MSHLDLNQPPPNHHFSVSVEREETDDERKVRLFKDVVLFIVAVGFVGLMAMLQHHRFRKRKRGRKKVGHVGAFRCHWRHHRLSGSQIS